MNEKNPKSTAGVSALVGTGAGALGLTYSYLKPSIPKTKRVRASQAEVSKFIQQLKPGDVLLTGSHRMGTPSKLYSTALRRNHPEYHTAVYMGKNLLGELLYDDKKPSKWATQKDLKYTMKKEGPVQAFRPINLSDRQQKSYVKALQKNLTTATYDDKAATKVYLQRLIGKKQGKCKGRFCSNVIATALPKKAFPKNVSREMALPKDFTNPKYFQEVAKFRPYKRIHLPASNPSLLKYVAGPALLATGFTAAYKTLS